MAEGSSAFSVRPLNAAPAVSGNQFPATGAVGSLLVKNGQDIKDVAWITKTALAAAIAADVAFSAVYQPIVGTNGGIATKTAGVAGEITRASLAADTAFSTVYAPISQGEVAYAAVTANQSGITAITDLTGLTVSYTAVAGRRYRITAKVEITATVADGVYVVTLADGSNAQLQRSTDACLTTSARTVHLLFVEVPGAGAVTRKLRLQKALGTGTIGLDLATASQPAFILVEDIGT